MLASVIGLYVGRLGRGGPTYLLPELAAAIAEADTATRWLFVGFFVAFAIKAPMLPVHTWLPDAADEATPGTSVLLVGVLDKIGTFGMIRFCLGLFPEASTGRPRSCWCSPSSASSTAALVAIGQREHPAAHRLHVGLALRLHRARHLRDEQPGRRSGSTLYMFNHGLSTAVLFLVTGFLIARRGSRQIADFGGVQTVAPVLAGIFLVGGLSSLSLPGLSPFVSRVPGDGRRVLHNWWYAAFAVFGIVLSALYILLMYQRTMTGPVRPGRQGDARPERP